jgi:hypothetical protein
MKPRRKRNRKLDPMLTESILPPGPPKLRITPQVRARCLAWIASHDLRAFAGTIHNGALFGDKLFFDYLAKYLRNKPKRVPIREDERRLVALISQNPHLRAQDAMRQLGWKGSTGSYGVMKKRALARSRLLNRIWRKGWSSEFKVTIRG